jgi:signal transduction histidine kinase
MAGGIGDRELELINALGGQAALLVVNMRLAGRIVGAQEAERRRLERNIHDGAQQELVALVAKLGLARARSKHGEVDDEMLLELQRDAQTILRDLRDLAQGIHPSVLTDGGLVEAVEDRCSRLPIDVEVESSPELRHQRFDDDVEGAAYFFVTEGLANILKHASASAARVNIHRHDGELELTVGDNGVGFDPAAIRQNGLAGLSDRFTALAGSVALDTRPGGGTVLTARLPVEAGRT